MLTDIDHIAQVRICSPGAWDQAVDATFRYHREDPLAVHLTFPAAVSLDNTEVTWAFARGLLDAGLRTPSGDGDVHIWAYGPHHTMIELRAREGVALVEVPTRDIRTFLTRTHQAVPPGREAHFLDLEAALAALLTTD